MGPRPDSSSILPQAHYGSFPPEPSVVRSAEMMLPERESLASKRHGIGQMTVPDRQRWTEQDQQEPVASPEGRDHVMCETPRKRSEGQNSKVDTTIQQRPYLLFTLFFAAYQELRVIQLGVPSNRMAKYRSLNNGCGVFALSSTPAHCFSSSRSQTCSVLSDRLLWMCKTPGSSSGTGSGG